MQQRDMIYHCDGSFEAILCCVFESYVQKENLTAIRCGEEDAVCLFPTREIVTDGEKSTRILHSLQRMSPEIIPFLRRVYLTDLQEKELAICRFILRLYREGASLLRRIADPEYAALRKAVRRMMGEVEALRGFVRFSDTGGVLAAEISPENRVLPFLGAHFSRRLHDDSFFIYDKTHREAVLYAEHRLRFAQLEAFVMAEPDRNEVTYRRLWRQFYRTVAIRERENEALCKSNLPLRYRCNMTEFQSDGLPCDAAPEEAIAPLTRCEVLQAPAAPNATPAPVTPSGYAQSDPA